MKTRSDDRRERYDRLVHAAQQLPPVTTAVAHPCDKIRSRVWAKRRGWGSLLRILKGQKALIVGVANERSIAWGCAAAMHRSGAEIAMTYLNDKARAFTPAP